MVYFLQMGTKEYLKSYVLLPIFSGDKRLNLLIRLKMATFAFINQLMKQMKTPIFILFSFILVHSVFAQQTDIPKYSLENDSLYRDSISTHKMRNVLGRATYYASKFHGRRTANGEVFNNRKMTAAHLKLPFGTFVTVTNLDNGRSVEVRVNDRGPHTKAFIIDLSQAAARELGFYGKGVAKVEICYQVPKK